RGNTAMWVKRTWRHRHHARSRPPTGRTDSRCYRLLSRSRRAVCREVGLRTARNVHIDNGRGGQTADSIPIPRTQLFGTLATGCSAACPGWLIVSKQMPLLHLGGVHIMLRAFLSAVIALCIAAAPVAHATQRRHRLRSVPLAVAADTLF